VITGKVMADRDGAISSALLAALAKYAEVRIADPKLSDLTEADWVKFRTLELAWKRSGDVAFDLLNESDFSGFFRIIAALNPMAMREALEAEILDRGMTNREFLEECWKKAKQTH
jgi:hypothetical protein